MLILCHIFLFFKMKIQKTNYCHNWHEYWYSYRSHIFPFQLLVLFFLSPTKESPIRRVNNALKITNPTINGESIAPKTEDSKSAVVIYLAISISHFPNSFLMSQSYTYFWLLGHFLLWKEGPTPTAPHCSRLPRRDPSLFSPLMIVLPCFLTEIILNGYLFELPRYSHHPPKSTGKLFHGISLIEFMKLSKLVISIVPA